MGTVTVEVVCVGGGRTMPSFDLFPGRITTHHRNGLTFRNEAAANRVMLPVTNARCHNMEVITL